MSALSVTPPKHWDVRRLKYTVRLASENVDSGESDLPFVALDHIESWTGRLVGTGVLAPDAIASSGRFRPGDVLFGKLRPYLAKVHLAQHDGICTGELLVLRPRLVDGRFLRYLLSRKEFIAAVDSSTYGAKMPRANWHFIGNIPISFPKLAEQRMIADFLDRETARVDRLVGEQSRLINSLREKQQSTIFRLVTKGLSPDPSLTKCGVEWLGDVPEHWKVHRMGAIFREACDAGHDDLPILSVSIHDGVSDKQLEDDELERKVTRSEDSSKYKAVLPSDLVYNMMRAWQGGFGTVNVAGMVSPAYVVARPTGTVMTKFIELLLRTAPAIEEMRRHSYGVADFRLRLYWDHFKTLQVALPPLPEQRQIVEAAQLETESIDLLVGLISTQNHKLAEYRSALISAAVTGQIDVRNYRPQEAAALCQ